MKEDSMLSIISTIIELCDEPAMAAPDALVSDLIACGFSPAEIKRAFVALENAAETIRKASPAVPQTFSAEEIREESSDAVRRYPSAIETIRMTEDAVRLYNDWQSLEILSPREAEEILRQVVLQEAGEIDAPDLVRIAQGTARPGSDLALHLSTQNAPLQ
jgi:uncharacterized protein Smg (DUF494 family)